MAECPRCNATVDPQRETCPACGTSLAGEYTDESTSRQETTASEHESQPTESGAQTGRDPASGDPASSGPDGDGSAAPNESSDGTARRVSRRQLLAGAGGVGVLAAAGWFGYPRVREFLEEPKTGWRTFRGDDARTGRVAGKEGPGESLDVAWTAEYRPVIEDIEDTTIGEWGDEDIRHVGGNVRSSTPVIADGIAMLWVEYELLPYANDAEQRHNAGILAFEGATGDLAWRRMFSSVAGRSWEPQPVMADGRVFLTTSTDDGTNLGRELVELNPDDGSVERRTTYDQPQAYVGPYVEGAMYSITTPTDGSAVSRVDSTDGSVTWSEEVDGYPRWRYPLTLSDDTLYRFDYDSDGKRDIVAHDVSDGSERWRKHVDLPEDIVTLEPETLTPPVISDGRGYCAGGIRNWAQDSGGELVSFDAGDGSDRWRFRPEPVPPLHAFGPGAGEETQEQAEELPGHSFVAGYPLLVDGTVVVGGIGEPASGDPEHDYNRHLFGVSDSDGSLEWSVPGVRSFAPVAAGDVIYAPSSDGELLAIGSNGEVHDSVTIDSYTPRDSRTPAIADGRVYLPGQSALVALE